MKTAELPPESLTISGAKNLVKPARQLRFTLDGDLALEQHLECACQRVLSGVRGVIPADQLEAVMLGGGYGRGEGGVLRDDAGDWPYNDLEFYVAVRGNRQLNELRYGRALDVLGEILTHLSGVEIECKITSLAELRARPISMFSYDLLAGHHLLWGDSRQFSGCEHHLRAEQIPPAEATRLLMNRGTGLLLARERLSAESFTATDADFVQRNVAKAALACGDAVLTLHGLYDWSCLKRHRRLKHLAQRVPGEWDDVLLEHHAMGLAFKLHPKALPDSRNELERQHAAVTDLARRCWLWVEECRLGRAFGSARAYARDPRDKLPEMGWWRNVALNLRADGFRAGLTPRLWRHPRQRIFHALALLLWDPNSVADEAILKQLQRELRTDAVSHGGLLRAYETLWRGTR